MLAAELAVSHEMILAAYWLVGFLVILNILSAASNIWSNVRRRPPIDKEFATKTEMLALEQRVISQIGDIADERQRSAAVLHRKLEEQSSAATARIEAQAAATASKFDQVVATMQAGFLDVQRAIGRLEGKIQHLTNSGGHRD